VTAADCRAQTLERLALETFDLLVAGAGITGARVALDAANAGLRVALVDQEDLASGASGASSKFIHGGFRYLTTGKARMVRAAQLEREELLGSIPDLVRPMPMILALDSRRYPRPLVHAGIGAYRCLAAGTGCRARTLSRHDALSLVPQLDLAAGEIPILLPEAQTDDARLTIETAKAAARAGAVVANYVSVEALELARGRVVAACVCDRRAGSAFTIQCRSIINASGAHIDALRRLEDRSCRGIARLSKGAHVVLSVDTPWRAGVASYSEDRRTIFAAPWQGRLLIGTTDTPFDGAPGSARAEPEDVTALLEGAQQILPAQLARANRVCFSFAGLRVLPRGDGDTAAASREHLLSVGTGGMVSVAGGKLTLHRLIAADALAALPADVRPRPKAHPRAPLVDRRPATLSAQATEAIEHEWATTVEDIVRRRTTLAVQGLDTARTRALLARLLHEAGFGGSDDVAAADLRGKRDPQV
jgi:glycerol-3-phosphate dehydrogenase